MDKKREKTNQLLMNAISKDFPLVLFLGQEFLSSIFEKDPILTLFSKKVDREDIVWADISTKISIMEDDVAWLSERFTRQIIPEAIVQNLEFPWSSVFTTSIDTRIVKYLATQGRQPETIILKDTFPKKARSKFRPPVYYLYSKVDEVEKNLIPLNVRELKKRQNQNTDFILSKLSDTVTSLGLLIIEGYTEKDWLKIDDFLAKIPDDIGFQILWCGLKTKPESYFFDEFVKQGLITYDERCLHQIFNELKSQNLLEFEHEILNDEPGLITLNQDTFIEVPPSLRLRVEAVASIIDDAWTNDIVLPKNEDETFRQFHGVSTSLYKHFEGVQLGYTIKRDFEERLEKRVLHLLQKGHGKKSNIIILNGQTATGKSTALSRLAITVRKHKQFRNPVLYALNRVPNLKEVDEFCQLVEKKGNFITLIICDANTLPDNYYELANGLSSRGRKAIIVGSSYYLDKQDEDNFITANVDINADELNSLMELIKQYTPNYRHQQLLKQVSELSKNHILALFYRVLKVSRASIVSGISAEAKATEIMLKERANNVPVTQLIQSQLSEQLIEAGLCQEELSILDDDNLNSELELTSAGKLIDYVMSVGRLNCFIPINLLIRVLSSHKNGLNLDQIAYIFQDLDLFRWHYDEDEKNELFIGPRISLEADLICRRRLSDKNKELACILDLISAVRDDTVSGNSELRFLSKLLQQLDQDGMKRDYYSFGYLKIAEELTRLRQNTKVEDASLMLRESSFRRAYLKSNDSKDITDENSGIDRNKILNEAREAVDIALSRFDNKKSRTYKHLSVERASIYGYLSVAYTKKNSSLDDVWSNYEAALIAADNALSGNNDYFPIDIILWTSIDILNQSKLLEDFQKAELHANILFMIDQVDRNKLSPRQVEIFLKQNHRAGKALENHEIEEEAILALKRTNPPVAYYLLARDICPEVFKKGNNINYFDKSVKDKAEKAFNFLSDNFDYISDNERCLILMVEYLWVFTIGRRLFKGERQPIPIDNSTFLLKLRELLTSINQLSSNIRNTFRYLEAVTFWLTNEEEHALNLWKELEQDTEYEDASRIIRRLYVATNDLQPKVFSGRIERELTSNKWIGTVTGLKQKVTILSSEFHDESLQIGREIKEFGISFNYLSAVADTRLLEMKK